jgi:hypothetical protein
VIESLQKPTVRQEEDLTLSQEDYSKSCSNLNAQVIDILYEDIKKSPSDLEDPRSTTWKCPIQFVIDQICSDERVSAELDDPDSLFTSGVLSHFLDSWYENAVNRDLPLDPPVYISLQPNFSLSVGAVGTVVKLLYSGLDGLNPVDISNFILAVANIVIPISLEPKYPVFNRLSPRLLAYTYMKLHQITWEQKKGMSARLKWTKCTPSAYIYSRDSRVSAINYFEFFTAGAWEKIADNYDKSEWYSLTRRVQKYMMEEDNPSVADHFEPVER